MQHKPLFIANWKMNLTEPEVIRFLTMFKTLVPLTEDCDIVVAPPYTSLRTATILLERTGISVAAQDVFEHEQGAYTGAVSARMLAAVGCRYVLVGHSERRQLWKEDDALIRRKVGAANEHGVRPVLCVGETAAERQEDRTTEVVERQIRQALEGMELPDDRAPAMAYEPVWAIGTGESASPDQVETVHRRIREVLEDLFAPPTAARIPILYGGSVNPETAGELMSRPEVDGLLVGTASLDPESFAAICACHGDAP